MSKKHHEDKFSALYAYVVDLTSFSRNRLVVLILLTIVVSLSQGVGLFMLIPFIRVLGVDSGASSMNLPGNQIIEKLLNIIHYFNLPFTLGTFLMLYFILVTVIKYANYKQNILNVTLMNQFTSSLRCGLFKAILSAEWSFISLQKSSNIAHVLTSDIPRVSTGTFFFLKTIIGMILTLFYVIWALMVSVKLTLFALVTFTVIFFLLRSHFPETFKKNVLARNALSGIYTLLLDHINGLKIAKSYCSEEREYAEFKRLSGDITETSIASSIVSSRTSMQLTLLTSLFLCVFLYISLSVLHIPVAGMILLIIIFSRLLPELMSIQQNIQQIFGMFPAFMAMKELLSQSEEHKEIIDVNPNEQKNFFTLEKSIRLENVDFSYGNTGESFRIRNLNLEIPALKITAITGPSGSGKSTIADLISGILRPDAGRLLIDGIPLTACNIYQWRQKAGYMPQEIFLFHDTVKNNILKGRPDAGDDEICEALKLASAYDLVFSTRDKLDTIIKDRGIRFSGGERQRISLARTLLRKPLLLILDEATNALDHENEEKILNDIKNLRGKLTILIISHKPSIISFADKVIKISKGKITETMVQYANS